MRRISSTKFTKAKPQASYARSFLKASLVMGAGSFSFLYYFSKQLDENSFAKKHFQWGSENIAQSTSAIDKNSSLYKKALKHTDNFVFKTKYDFQLFLATATIGLFNELWKKEVAFQALSYIVFSYMHFIFLSEAEENRVA